jgi:AcrR family transcriptional regulator
MPSSHPSQPTTPNKGSAARQRLIDVATEIFSERGYDGASVREICAKADANIAAIKYYFGGKEALYREIIETPRQRLLATVPLFTDPVLTALEAFRICYLGMLEPLRLGRRGLILMRLHHREMTEPTGLVEIGPQSMETHYRGLVGVLCHHLGLADADPDLHILAFALIGLCHGQMLGHAVEPTLIANLERDPTVVERIADRLAGYATLLIDAERARRAGGLP